ncbi:hypothetical protein K439DRAFT_1618699 [Ramaria rubella]|nr:hypothetical protein K439DRAFT_1618699 [Ramaria rubella]
MKTGLYYLARVVESDTDTRTVTLQWLDMNYVEAAGIDPHIGMPTFTVSFQICYNTLLVPLHWPWATDTHHLNDNIDLDDTTIFKIPTLCPSVQHTELYGHLCTQLPHIQDILTAASEGFPHLMEEWQQDSKNRSRKGSTFFLSFAFFRCHAELLDKTDIYIIEVVCSQQLARQLQQCSAANLINSDELDFGPSSAMMAYIAVGFYLGTSPDLVHLYASQGIIFRDRLVQESTWDVMQCHVLIGVLDACKFELSHRIPDQDIPYYLYKFSQGWSCR